MQQLYLTGSRASALAERLFTAHNVRPAGYRLLPFSVGGEVRGDAIHLLLAPSAPMHNDLPCRILLSSDASTIVPRVLDEVAAPCLLGAMAVHVPMLLDGMTADMLGCPAFREAVTRCLMGSRPVVVVAEEDARPLLRTLTPQDKQLWFAVPEEDAARAFLLETLIAEAALRF